MIWVGFPLASLTRSFSQTPSVPGASYPKALGHNDGTGLHTISFLDPHKSWFKFIGGDEMMPVEGATSLDTRLEIAH